jgi:ABC-type branched-subunit amino acid transport system substrate-binding protein
VKPNYHAANGYVVMQITAAAVKGASSFDPEKVRDALTSMTVYTIKGPFKANERGVSATIEYLHFQIRNGKRVIVWPAHQAEARFLPMPKWADRGKK